MTAPAPAAAPGREPPGGPGQVPRAEPGDTLVIDGAGGAGLPRTGTIIAVSGQDGSPPYLVHWTVGVSDAQITPGPGARTRNTASQPS